MQSRLRPLCAAKVLKKLQLPKLLVPHLDKICLRELGVAGQAPIEIEITGAHRAQSLFITRIFRIYRMWVECDYFPPPRIIRMLTEYAGLTHIRTIR